jgi:hypothetical protein
LQPWPSADLTARFNSLTIRPREDAHLMIKALLLIFSSQVTWTRIAEAPRKWSVVLITYLLPLVLIVCAAEGYGLIYFGKQRGQIPKLVHFSISEAAVYEAGQVVLSLLIVFVGARLIKSLGDTFHGRHSFSQAFTVAAYGLGPFFLLHLLDALPNVPPWLPWALGICLSISVLYSGIPIVMKPDPPHALGLYLMSSMFLAILTGLVRFVSAWYLKGKFTKLDAFIAHFVQ